MGGRRLPVGMVDLWREERWISAVIIDMTLVVGVENDLAFLH